jgi:hypothetical protein
MFEISARRKGFNQLRFFILVAAFAPRRFSQIEATSMPRLRDPAPPWPPPPPCSRVLPLTLFFSVSLWLCGEYLSVAAMLHCVYRWPNRFVCLPRLRRFQGL